jgi:hypothetical protein
MSSDDQALEEGRMLDRLRAARKELVSIRSRCKTLAPPLRAVSDTCEHGRFDAPAISASISQLPTQEEVLELFSNARAAQKVIKDTLAELAQTGIEIK